jgi:signal transduction histidine kinase
VGSALWKRSWPYLAGGHSEAVHAAPGAVLPAAPGAAGVTAVRRDTNAGQILIAVAGLLSGAGVAWIVSNAGPVRASFSNVPFALPVAVLVGWSFIGSGLLAWRPRPGNHLGAALIFTGFAWFASVLPDAHNPVLFTVGEVVQLFYYAGFIYLILSFPSGRLRGALDRGLVAATIVLVTIGRLGWLLFADSRAVICSYCPANLLEVARDDALARRLFEVQLIAALPVAAVGLGLLAGRWRRASHAQRHAVMPVAAAGVVAIAAAAAFAVALALGAESAAAVLSRAGWYAAAAIPVAVLAVFVQRRLAHGAVAGLVVELGGRGAVADPREALSRALGDPSLTLGYWFAAESRYVDRAGGPVELPGPESGRRSTVVERDGQPVAVLIHDPALEHNARLVDSVCAAAGLALENERLQAELRARLVELQASRARLVEATDAERRRIERDLHDGTQQRLVSIAMSLGLAESKLPADGEQAKPIVAESREALAAALAELRDLTQGIYPTILTERGLPAALDELCRRSALTAHLRLFLDGRLPAPVETAAYYVVSEALTNAAKHAQAREARVAARCSGGLLTVEVADDGVGGAGNGKGLTGSGLRGLADRVEALGGRLTVSSPPGRGTTLRAEFPCG